MKEWAFNVIAKYAQSRITYLDYCIQNFTENRSRSKHSVTKEARIKWRCIIKFLLFFTLRIDGLLHCSALTAFALRILESFFWKISWIVNSQGNVTLNMIWFDLILTPFLSLFISIYYVLVMSITHMKEIK